MQAFSILSQVGMSNRAAYYSGRGAGYGDLTTERLVGIKNLIKRFHGDKAALSFVLMVQFMPDLGATDFINNLSQVLMPKVITFLFVPNLFVFV